MAAILVPSSVDTVVDWAKANTAISALVSTRVSSTLPKKGLVYPWLTVQRITGLPLYKDMPMDKARIQFNAWGGVKSNDLPNWEPADTLIRTLEAEIREFSSFATAGAYVAEMSSLEGIMQLEDPDTHEARFWMDATVLIRRADGQ